MIGGWIAVGILLIIGLVLLQIGPRARKYKIIVILIVGAILYFSIMGTFSSEEVDLVSPKGMVNTVYLYFGWIGYAATSLYDIGIDSVTMVGNAIKIDSSPEEDERRRR